MHVPEIFLDMVNRSITAGIVILAVLLARELLRRAGVPRRYIYLLWLIPALRLLCPLSVSSAASLFNLPVFDRAAQTETGLAYLPRELAALAVREEPSEDMRAGFYGMSQVRRDVGEPANYYGGRVFELSERDTCRGEECQGENSQGEERQGENRHSVAGRETAVNPVEPGRAALWVLSGIWVGGMAAVLLWQTGAYVKIRRKTACAARLPGGDGNVYECEGIRTPFAMGLLRGKIYIPYRMSEKEREYVLLHEQCHLVHRDLWARTLACVLLAVYWYNPLVWLGVRCMERDMEMRCDEYVLGQMGEEIRYDYSLSLLSYAGGRSRRPMGITAFGESGTGKRVKHVLRYRRTGICVAVLALAAAGAVALVCLTDRSAGEEPGQESREPVAVQEKTYFWGQQAMRLELPENHTDPAMYLVGRSVLPLSQETQEGTYGESMRCAGEHCFFLARPVYGEESTAYEMQVFDGDKKEWSSGLVDGKLLGQGVLYDLFAVSDRELVYLVLVRDGWRYEHYYAVHVSREGEELKRVDLLPVCQELDMIVEQVLPTNICVDSVGNYYMVSLDGKRMAILDKEGGLLENRDCSVKYKRIIPWMTPGPDGGILTQSYHETNGMEWTWLDGDREKSLGAVRNANFGDRLIPLDNGLCYYITAEKRIFQGNAATGEAQYLYDAGGIIGIRDEVLVNGDGEVILLTEKQDRAVAYVLSRERETHMGAGGESITATDPLRVCTYGGYESGSKMPIEQTLPIFMAEHPEYAFDLQVIHWKTYYEEGHDRLWNELIAGEGPDIFYVDEKDLTALWEKGVLLDLRELVSQETLDMIYPGLLDTGMVDGSLAGVSTHYSVQSMVTSREIWPGEQWTLEDMVTLLEAGDRPHGVSDSGYRWIGGSALMYRLGCYNLAHSPFIDWERGTCSFDSELFVRLLEVAKAYEDDVEDVEGYEEYYAMAGYRQLLENGCVAVEDSVQSLDSYVRIRQCMGESYNRIGLPGDTGSNQVARAGAYIVVNKNCANREAAAAYLEFVLSQDSIINFRRDARDFFKVGRDWEGKWAVIDRDIEGTYLGYLLDRNDPALLDEEMPEVYVKYLEYAEEYYRFMESLEGQSPSDGQIEKIISEEVENYFQNGQSAENVAQVIQSRVQVYLSERQ